MKDVYLLNYKVSGIKTIDSEVELSFYKRNIGRDIDTKGYNIKGIYGMNGSGKSGLITSFLILKNLLINEKYLDNPVIQKYLEEIINKKTKELHVEAEIIWKFDDENTRYKYQFGLGKNGSNSYELLYEKIAVKPAISRRDYTPLLETKKGEIVFVKKDKKDSTLDLFIKKSENLLLYSSASSIFVRRIFATNFEIKEPYNQVIDGLIAMFYFGKELHVYIDQPDEHEKYIINNMYYSKEFDDVELRTTLLDLMKFNGLELSEIDLQRNIIRKDEYQKFVYIISKLEHFIKVFKDDLVRIEIDKKENADYYVCSLNMVYNDYSINTEYESTGIKKLIKLFMYIKEMVEGGIVFIDEFDSNLHDVYLCALLEYLIEFGKGQLCFTTHNVGPMDVLKENKNSIDFLSQDHKVYSWVKNGNYSPSKLYRKGMMEGSPFNVDSYNFIGIFDDEED